MKKKIMLLFLAIIASTQLKANRTLVIKCTIPDTKENGVEVDVVQVDPTRKNMFGKLVPFFWHGVERSW